jgi:hypothetical protein
VQVEEKKAFQETEIRTTTEPNFRTAASGSKAVIYWATIIAS